MKWTPVRLQPHYETHLWGGTMLRDVMGKDIPAHNTGESWEVSAHAKGQSLVMDGPWAGMTLNEYIAALGDEAFYGENAYASFPLLVKLIGPEDTLSVQVHPSDEYPNLAPGERGKSEAWVVLSAPEGACIVCGVNCSRDVLAQAMEQGEIQKCLCAMSVKRGDIIPIPPGCIHALTKGVLVYEIQQSSDTTYRLYDWDRVDPKSGLPRELHKTQALDVMEKNPVAYPKATGIVLKTLGMTRRVCLCNDYFALDVLSIQGKVEDEMLGFGVYTVVEGELQIFQDDKLLFTASKGQTFLAPAAAMGWQMEGNAQVLKGYACGRVPLATYLRRESVPQDDLQTILGI